MQSEEAWMYISDSFVAENLEGQMEYDSLDSFVVTYNDYYDKKNQYYYNEKFIFNDDELVSRVQTRYFHFFMESNIYSVTIRYFGEENRSWTKIRKPKPRNVKDVIDAFTYTKSDDAGPSDSTFFYNYNNMVVDWNSWKQMQEKKEMMNKKAK